LEDLNSTNGTFVNGVPLGAGPVRLNDGDEVSLGTVVTRYGVIDPSALTVGKRRSA
jgi:pSer/pThr/pTyr-binding forkhead associated (FHA) protein